MMLSSPCGIFNCETCQKGESVNCPGCLAGNDYLERRGLAVCGIFDCVREHGVACCADCTDGNCKYSRSRDTICFLHNALSGKRLPFSLRSRSGDLPAALLRQAGGGAVGPVKDPDASGKPEYRRRIPDRTVTRLRWYLLIVEEMSRRGIRSVSSREIAAKAGVNAALVRKDLSYFGDFGTPSFGYDVKYLLKKIAGILHLNEMKHIVWLGASRLEESPAVFLDLPQHNCFVVAVMDIDEHKIGTRVRELQVLHMSSLPQVVSNLDIDAAVLALPPEHAQEALNAIAAAGIRAVLNLTPAILDVPAGVNVRNVDVTGELVALSFYCGRDSEV